MKRLPETEYDIMRVIWTNPSPITTTEIMAQLGRERGWSTPALITMLTRLTDKGFIYSEKEGKLRKYYPLVKKNDYLEFVTNEFLEKYHGGSFSSFFATLFDLRMVSDETLDSFVAWVKGHRKEFRRYFPD